MRRFALKRTEDKTDTFGTGYVADGIQWRSGKCALEWRVEFSSVAVYDNIESLEKDQYGKVSIEWIDPEIGEYSKLENPVRFDLDKVSQLIKELRAKSEFTAAQLANLVKFSEASILLYESGKRSPKLKTLSAIGRACEVDISFLIE